MDKHKKSPKGNIHPYIDTIDMAVQHQLAVSFSSKNSLIAIIISIIAIVYNFVKN